MITARRIYLLVTPARLFLKDRPLQKSKLIIIAGPAITRLQVNAITIFGALDNAKLIYKIAASKKPTKPTISFLHANIRTTIKNILGML